MGPLGQHQISTNPAKWLIAKRAICKIDGNELLLGVGNVLSYQEFIKIGFVKLEILWIDKKSTWIVQYKKKRIIKRKTIKQNQKVKVL